MKYILSLMAAVLFQSFSYAQNFPGESPELLLNKTVKPMAFEPNFQKYHYKNFYKKFDAKTNKLGEDRIFPTKIFTSEYEKLLGVEFKVMAIHEQSSTKSTNKHVLELNNDELGTVYYDYDSKYDFSFELEVVGGLDIPEGFYCNGIKTTTDKFTGETREIYDYYEGIQLIKSSKDGDSKIYFAINQTGPTLNIGEKGLTLLLENGKRIERPEAPIDVKSNSAGKNYVYSAFIELTKSEIDLIINNPITDNRLYVYDGIVKNGQVISEYLKCLIK